MQEEMLSMIAQEKLTIGNVESSDSNGSIHTAGSKRIRVEKYKGVVLQSNGHWGAQIYADHQRVWLGTFKSDVEAAMAYDSAAMKLGKEDSHRNFPRTSANSQESQFQNLLPSDVVLNMIRDGSYPSKFADYLKSQQNETDPGVVHSYGQFGFKSSLLFEKELTPSDVGKLNRLVIPKRFAVKHFPNVPELPEDESLEDPGRADDVQLEFFDKNMKLWKFRYCYWKSSQSFVFTRGWNKFVKEKGLTAADTVAFYLCEGQSVEHFGQSFIMIDVAPKQAVTFDRNVEPSASGFAPDTKRIRLFGFNINV